MGHLAGGSNRARATTPSGNPHHMKLWNKRVKDNPYHMNLRLDETEKYIQSTD
jgi:hypothetical protein